MCGKNITDSILQCCLWGSPPRVREKLHFFVAFACASRITPACAGKTLGGIHQSLTTRDHPRVCGKNLEYLLETLTLWGSPPRVREKPVSGFVVVSNVGITPACAGKTIRYKLPIRLSGDHPRVCGKNPNTEI